MLSVKKNLVWNILLTVSGYLFPLITFPYITRVLGAGNLGLANFALSVVDYAILFSTFGLGSIGFRYIPQCNDNIEQRNHVFNHLVTLHLILSVCILIIYTFCIFLIPQLYEHKLLYFVGASKIIMNVFLVEWLFQGMQDFRYITIRTLIIRLLYVFSIFLWVRESDDYDIYFYLTIAQVVVNAIVNWRYTCKYVTFKLSIRGCRSYLFPVFSMGINRILLSFYGTFSVIYLGFICSDESVGYFTTATKLYGIFIAFLGAYNGVFVPYLNSLFGKGDMIKFKQYIGYSFSIVSLLSIPLIVGGIILAPEIVIFIAGPGFESAILPFQIVMIQVLFVGFAQILENQILLSLKKFKEVLICTSISTAMAVFIIFAYVPQYAEVAAAYAVAIPHLLELVLLFYYSQKSLDFKFPIVDFLKNIAACIPIAVICILAKKLGFNSFLTLLIAVIVSSTYYFVVQYFLIRDRFLRSQVQQVTKKLEFLF